MIGLALLLALTAPRVPAQLVVATPRGETRLTVTTDADGRPMVPARTLAAALGHTTFPWATWRSATRWSYSITSNTRSKSWRTRASTGTSKRSTARPPSGSTRFSIASGALSR
jgi:hypothetical protein